MTLQAVIFDLDGTLADTEEVHRQAFNATFCEVGLAPGCRSPHRVAGCRWRQGALRHYFSRVDPVRLSAPDTDTFIARLHEHKTRTYNRRVAKGEVLARPGVIRLIEIESREIPATQLKGWFP
ncbi:MAG: HAD hydrolase-like protein [Dechloromonas sp.]|uniref:HAD hydrolase-like protein n=1 Tax=Dechloromonas sp. CZR5 TaxID=2608630 RepID=UPI00123D857C|nr:HAD hydrolase-like protein [Dechloromonas sp. CZR5]MBS4020176.1 HAD hydrolase-like protein [Dechloromonas sp.]